VFAYLQAEPASIISLVRALKQNCYYVVIANHVVPRWKSHRNSGEVEANTEAAIIKVTKGFRPIEINVGNLVFVNLA